MKTYPTLVRFPGMGYSRIIEQTAAQRGSTEQVLDQDALNKAHAFKFDWAAFEQSVFKRRLLLGQLNG